MKPIILNARTPQGECIGAVRLTPEAERVVRRLSFKTGLPIRQRKPDEAHIRTDRELAALEKRIAAVYKQAAKDMQGKIDAYFASLAKQDEEQREKLDAGEITEEYYKQWRLAQIGRGERMEKLRDQLAERMTRANEVSAAYINDAAPGIYSLNRNYAAYTIERQVGEDVGFTLWDEQAVERMITDRPDLMPYYPEKRAVKRGIDLAWGKRQITSQITTGILQGESVKYLVDRLQTNIPGMNRDSAIRAARTAVTGAQNAGRMDSYHAAEEMGIKIKKRWLATLDGRTRHTHAALDGTLIETDETFSNGCRYPGDPDGPPSEVYNCRCTLIADVEGVDTSGAKRRARDLGTGESVLISNMGYLEWVGWKQAKTVDILTQSAIIESTATGSGGMSVKTIGRIDVEKFRVVSDKIRTNEVVITDERIEHIRQRHPNDFERFSKYLADIVESPQYILEANKPNTAFLLKEYEEDNERFQLILRLAVEGDRPEYKNSVITFLHVEKKRFNRYLRTKKILYKSE